MKTEIEWLEGYKYFLSSQIKISEGWTDEDLKEDVRICKIQERIDELNNGQI